MCIRDRQDVFLFADTVRENIRYGRPDATDEEIVEAAKRAEIYDDIMALSLIHILKRSRRMSASTRMPNVCPQ